MNDDGFGDIDELDSVDSSDDKPTQYGSGIYLTDLARWLRDAGLVVIEYAGWQTRARGSGGYKAYPLCVMWHHTASGPSWDGQRDADYLATGHEDSPISNFYIDRSGTCWVIAAGAANTNGTGNAMQFSRGTVPQDSMNTHSVAIEMGNDGIGEPWPQVQIDAAFKASNAVNAHLGNQPEDMSTHYAYTPGRKIDPATAAAVQGPWKPRSCSTSGTWDCSDVRAECRKRATAPHPPKLKDGEMALLTRSDDNSIWVVAEDFSWRQKVSQSTHDSIKATGRYGLVAIVESDLNKIPTS